MSIPLWTRTATCLTVLTSLAGCHQPAAHTVDRLVIGEVMMHSEFAPNLRALATPGGRLTGTPNARRAEEYVATKLREYGLSNVHYEPFDMACWTVHETRVTVLTDPPRILEGAVALGYTMSTPAGGITAEVVDLGEPSGEDFAARASDLVSKFVLVRDGGLSRREKLELALKYGAVGMIVMRPPDRLPLIGNGHSEARPEPVVVVAHDEELVARLERGEIVRLNVWYETENWPCRPRNVVGEIRGHGPLAGEVVIACAHLDSWHLAEGALDNGNGSAAILETARALAAVGWQPRRTVRFVWFMAEEIGLVGSRAYVRDHADEMADIVAVVNLDMPGSPRRIGVVGDRGAEGFVRDLLDDALRGYELDCAYHETTGDWSDHAPFMRAGVCTMWLGGDIGAGGKFYHTTGDTYETVDRRGAIPASAVLGVLLRRLADVPVRSTSYTP